MTFEEAQAILKTAGVEFAAGMKSDEFDRVETTYGFRFPPDLREFLSIGLPISKSWVDWRGGDETKIRERLNWPLEGICFDVGYNACWLEEWGPRPEDSSQAIEIVTRVVASAPVLIPIASHRYIPASPSESGNPVFSVHQSDIIYYGVDLIDYLHIEFGYYFGRARYAIDKQPRQIPIWSRFVEANE